jgi:putative transposase
MGHIDDTELNLVLCDSRTGQPLGKCWLTLLILSHPRRIGAYYLTFNPPSYRSCMMVLRLCVKRYGRLPTAITVDGGPEFQSVYFEQLLALYRVRKHQRPASEPRFGSPQERLFGTLETEFLYHLLGGNTQATREPRQMTNATDPERLAVWTLPDLAERVQQWADEEYETLRHPALGMTPRTAYELSIKRDGQRIHKEISYDETFRMTTFPTTRKGTALVRPGVGVRVNYLEYWCEAMRDATVEGTQVNVRYEPFDVSVGYAYIDGVWRQCFTPYDEFAGCSERELQLLASEVRQNNRLQYGREQD